MLINLFFLPDMHFICYDMYKISALLYIEHEKLKYAKSKLCLIESNPSR